MNNTTDYGTTSYDNFLSLDISSLIFFAVLSIVTTLTNGLVLLTIFKDPLKSLRSPSAYFISGISSANMITGIAVEPLLVVLYSEYVVDGEVKRSLQSIFEVTVILSYTAVNASLLVILALAVSQYIGIASPALYRKIVSQKSAKIGVACIFLYAILFSLLPTMGVNLWSFLQADMYLHTTLVTVSLVVVYILMYCKFRQMWGPTEVRGSEENEQQRREMDREFIKGTFILTVFLVVTVWPYAITLYLLTYYEFESMLDIRGYIIAFRICQMIFFLKFALDPLVFAWRLKVYRRSFLAVLQAICSCGARSALPAVSYHASDNEGLVEQPVETVVV